MKKPIIIYGILALVVIGLATIIFLNPSKKIDTKITLVKNDKIPYGTNAAFEFTKVFFPKAKVISNAESPENWRVIHKKDSGQLLIIVNSYFNPTEEEVDLLTSFAQKGNYIIISALQMNENASKYFRVKERNYFNNDYYVAGNQIAQVDFDSLTVYLDSETFKGPLRYSYPGIGYDNYFEEIDSLITYPIGYNAKKQPNLLALNSLKGTIFLHSAPIAFSNLFFLYNQNHLYLQNLLSAVGQTSKPPKTVIWDDYFLNKKPYEPEKKASGVLSVILKYPNFRWAFWIALSALCLYVITEAKRKQQSIPLYSKPANESLAFVTTIGKLYYNKGEHKNLAEKLHLYFLDYIRNKYKIEIRKMNKNFVDTISQKTNVPKEEVDAIYQTFTSIHASDKIDTNLLSRYYQQLEEFYKKA